jgi:microsomal epoxide hydrolase
MGFALFPKEINVPARSSVEQAVPNVIHWTEMPRGGHFAAMEQAEALVRDVRVFFALVRRQENRP